MNMYVLHIKPFFLPVDIHHPAHPVSVPFFLLERYKLCGHKITTSDMLHCIDVSRVVNAMTCHRTGYDGYEDTNASNPYPLTVDRDKTKETETNKNNEQK